MTFSINTYVILAPKAATVCCGWKPQHCWDTVKPIRGRRPPQLFVALSGVTYRALVVATDRSTCRVRTLMLPRGKILWVQGQIPSRVVLRSLSGRPCTGWGCPLHLRSQRRPPLAIAHDLDDALKLSGKGVFNSLESELCCKDQGADTTTLPSLNCLSTKSPVVGSCL